MKYVSYIIFLGLCTQAFGGESLPLSETYASVQARGVSDQKQIRDDLILLNEGVQKGEVRQLADIKQPALKDLMQEISQDSHQMKEIEEKHPDGSDLEKISTTLNELLSSQE